jgi:hypothetical protein
LQSPLCDGVGKKTSGIFRELFIHPLTIALNVQRSTRWQSLVTDSDPALSPPADHVS